MQLIDGKKIATKIIDDVANQIVEANIRPQLAVLLVGNDPASELYVKLKEKKCAQTGILFNKYLIDENKPEQEIIDTIDFLNKDPEIDAILIQLPLPKKFDQEKIITAMDHKKDVDGFHPVNIKRYLDGKKQHILPGLSLAIWNLIASTGKENYIDKNAIIIAKSEHFTLPTKKLLSDQKINVSIVRPNDSDLKDKCLEADIIITAIGKPNSITKDMVKKDAIIIDVGINKVGKKTVGDVDFNNVAPITSYITPVPGGVGPMTIAMLLFNTVALARERHESISEKK